ncbi:DUF5989 family protein [Roseiconus lacunae]|uniref:DUF5989 family protein n=1 Tax=Roseiconus lacunae TaxID=2605694 RepID=A0ABT7PQV5_9BACT|nr:DUF5989 family protein [Roseiconus lacunae]MDM4018895.1 DUF5989 family protein [Roseiconus lacunae]
MVKREQKSQLGVQTGHRTGQSGAERTTTSTELSQQPSGGDAEQTFFAQADTSDPGLVREFIWFLRYNKKWWLLPIVVVLLLLVALAFVTTSPAAPFIYTLF